jgi:hypothetical protein
MGDELDYAALAVDAERKAMSAESLHRAALWRELAATYRELADCLRPRPEVAPSAEARDP